MGRSRYKSVIAGLRRPARWALLSATAALIFGSALAAPPPVSIPVDPESYTNGQANSGPFGFLNTLDRSNYLLGDMWGLRPFLSRYGASLAIQETSEVLGNVTGGKPQPASNMTG